ncbi:MAG: M23 family metallopeptidase [Phormidesmis sp.]
MTAPQHNAKPVANQPKAALENSTQLDVAQSDVTPSDVTQPNSQLMNSSTDRQTPLRNFIESRTRHNQRPTAKRMQRSWLIALGLLGGSGFVANQMSFALAESDFLIDEYAVAPSEAAADHSVADTTFTYAESPFTPAVAPAQVEYVPAPAATPAPVRAAAPAEPDWVAQYQAPAPAPVAAAPAAPAVVTPAPSIEIEIKAAPVHQAANTRAQSSVPQPTVSAVAPPSFSSVRKPKKASKKASKIARRSGPLQGLVDATAMTVPLAGYGAGSMAIAPSMVQLSARAQANGALDRANSNQTTTVVALEGGSVEMEIAPSSNLSAVPDILPAEGPEAVAAPIQPTELVPAALPEGSNLPDEYNNVFVDPTDYSVGATQAPTAGASGVGAPEIVVTEQSTGCEFTVAAGQGVPNAACGTQPGLTAAPAPVANGKTAPAQAERYAAQDYIQTPAAASSAAANNSAINVGPVSFSAEGIRFSGSTTAAGREYLNRTVRPLVNLQANEQFIFPLAVPSPITSLFGFRTHPITGDQRFHAGTDIGAAQGTPVLAAQDGKVSSTGYAGGYGLMVVLNHKLADSQLESRYAHLSEILVEPNATVKKGDVIGLVGSTGNSTGPHLHFEMRQLTADGWVLVNPDGLVQYSLANLVKALNNPLQAMNFSMADFNLLRTRSATAPSTASAEVKTETAADSPLPGLNGIPFRPAQPNAS